MGDVPGLVFRMDRRTSRRRADDELRNLLTDVLEELDECIKVVESYSVPDGECYIQVSVEQRMKPKETSNG